MIRILLFAGLADLAGTSEITLDEFEGRLSIKEIQQRIIERYPDLENILSKSMAAVNHEYASLDDLVGAEDELAFIPPVSGG